MDARRHRDLIPWSSRVIEPPGNIPALRQAVAARPDGVLLESIARDKPAGRFSIFAVDPVQVMAFSGHGRAIRDDGKNADPFEQLASVCRPWGRLDPEPNLPFVGGWIGYLAYEAGRYVEPTAWLSPPSQSHGQGFHQSPLSYWALFDTVVIHDAAAEQWSVAGVVLLDRLDHGRGRPPLAARLDAAERFVRNLRLEGRITKVREGVLPIAPDALCRWNIPRDRYLTNVQRALDYIRAGDIFQVNVARRCQAEVAAHPGVVYQCLCDANPAAYAAYVSGPGSSAVLSSSPELFLSLRDRSVVTRPIKGTRPRDGDPRRDAAARRALDRSAKDRAELNMIIDLERNDLGRVCEFGTVRVAQGGEIEAHPTVYHRVATVEGRLREDCDAIDLLRATFPGGSVTGAPKVRAMQIINELEPDPRGPYCGAVGTIGLDGDLQLNLAIRTMSVQGAVQDGAARSTVTLHVGSGIVADSDPEEEYAELQAKAAGMLKAIAAASAGARRPIGVTRRPLAGPTSGAEVEERSAARETSCVLATASGREEHGREA